MAKAKVMYSCQECGTIHTKWSGKCAECGSWNSLLEEHETGGLMTNNSIAGSAVAKGKSSSGGTASLEFEKLDDNIANIPRVKTNIAELDRVLGGGLVDGCAILIGGDPGIGKSTLLLQVICALANNNVSSIYISGEESTNQVRIRAKRLGLEKAPVKLASTMSVDNIISTIDCADPPQVVVIDSIQTMFTSNIASAPGTVSQVRSCAAELITLAKRKNIIMLIVSHVTKEGQIAGPKVLEHMVDTVLYFEGERNHQFRILRSIKNRYGAANEIGVFEMRNTGLEEVANPSELFLSSRRENISGTSVFAGMEGTRPILVEVQALISPSYIPTPRRAVVGWDLNRLAMILAVMHSRFGMNLSDKEVYLNIAGGLKVTEPAVDLAVACALVSAFRDIAFPGDIAVIGEIGLSGEIRMVSHIESRVKEARKLGFKKAIVPNNAKALKSLSKTIARDFEIIPIFHIRDLVQFFKK